MTDTLTILGTIAGSGAITAAVHGVARWARHRDKNRAQVAVSEAEADAAEAVAREQGAAAVVPELLTEIRAMRTEHADLRRRTDECEGHRAECREELTSTQGELRETRAHVGRLAERLAEVMSDRGETTGLHEVLDIAASNTPIPGPPPRETMLPPSGGEET